MLRLLPVTLLILLLTSCFPFDLGPPPPRPDARHLDVSTGAATAVILDSLGWCCNCFVIKVGAMDSAFKSSFGERVKWKVDAGPITATSMCRVGSEPNLYSNFNFEAEPGHTYRVEMRNRECTRLVDVTSDEHLVACEPATD